MCLNWSVQIIDSLHTYSFKYLLCKIQQTKCISVSPLSPRVYSDVWWPSGACSILPNTYIHFLAFLPMLNEKYRLGLVVRVQVMGVRGNFVWQNRQEKKKLLFCRPSCTFFWIPLWKCKKAFIRGLSILGDCSSITWQLLRSRTDHIKDSF